MLTAVSRAGGYRFSLQAQTDIVTTKVCNSLQLKGNIALANPLFIDLKHKCAPQVGESNGE